MDPEPETLRDVMEIFHSMLKALNFLHSHNIVHRDIAFKNMLMNHHCDFGFGYDTFRNELRSSGQLLYAMIDFDIAVAFPPDSARLRRRLPRAMSFAGTWPHPDDTAQGEPDYDPFAFDVGCMGILFSTMVQRYTAELPFLAPFLDGMTTKDVPRRSSAGEALQVFEAQLKNACPDALAKPYRSVEAGYYEDEERLGLEHSPVELAES